MVAENIADQTYSLAAGLGSNRPDALTAHGIQYYRDMPLLAFQLSPDISQHRHCSTTTLQLLNRRSEPVPH